MYKTTNQIHCTMVVGSNKKTYSFFNVFTIHDEHQWSIEGCLPNLVVNQINSISLLGNKFACEGGT